MAEIQNLQRLNTKLQALAKQYGEPTPSVVVGYTQRYAVYVHERHANHKVGSWKYLETPARLMNNDGSLVQIIGSAVKEGHSLEKALLAAGMMLQRISQDEYCPVDTSALKASAFTCPERDLDSTAAAKFSESEAVRLSQEHVRNKAKGKDK